MRRFLRTIPGVEYCYGQYKLQRYRWTYGREFSRLLDTAPSDIRPLQLANSLNQFEWVVRHRLFPSDLLARLLAEARRAVRRHCARRDSRDGFSTPPRRHRHDTTRIARATVASEGASRACCGDDGKRRNRREALTPRCEFLVSRLPATKRLPRS